MMPTALIVEDEPEANKLLSLLVQLRGYKTYSAFTGGDALELVQYRRPDVVFLDLMLPDTNGYDVCRALKGQRQTTLIPIIMVSARLAAENRVMSYGVGANEYVPKPYTPDQIFEAMAAASSWRRKIEANSASGQITLECRDEVEAFAQLGQLQSVLLTRTAWDEEAVRQLSADLFKVSQNVVAWGRRHGVDPVASVRFEVHTQRVLLTVQDLGGWFSSHDLPHEEALGLLIGHGRFDSVEYSNTGSGVLLEKRFQTG
ncbi:MAG TPA: response regulator, partial [Isosphaeraceae bacterium]|nr:response regulator [Isosphaeraceae bacterium]